MLNRNDKNGLIKTWSDFSVHDVCRWTIKSTTFNIQPPCVHTTQRFAMTRTRDFTSPSINVEDGLIWERRVIRRHLTHTAIDSCNQQKKEEGDSRGQLVSSDKAFCITSDWVGILRRCTVMIVSSVSACPGVLSEDLCHFVFMCVFIRAREWREKERTWECLCKSRTRAGKCKHNVTDCPSIKKFNLMSCRMRRAGEISVSLRLLFRFTVTSSAKNTYCSPDKWTGLNMKTTSIECYEGIHIEL